jgi:hypothetical protein
MTPRVTTGATANNVFSDYFEDASYVRIQNVQLGYSLNSRYTEKAGITKLRLYAGVNNLYTFTKYKGFDPGASMGLRLVAELTMVLSYSKNLFVRSKH